MTMQDSITSFYSALWLHLYHYAVTHYSVWMRYENKRFKCLGLLHSVLWNAANKLNLWRNKHLGRLRLWYYLKKYVFHCFSIFKSKKNKCVFEIYLWNNNILCFMISWYLFSYIFCWRGDKSFEPGTNTSEFYY